MQNKVMFIIGCVIFVIYVYFLLTIIKKQHQIQRDEHKSAYKAQKKSIK